MAELFPLSDYVVGVSVVLRRFKLVTGWRNQRIKVPE